MLIHIHPTVPENIVLQLHVKFQKLRIKKKKRKSHFLKIHPGRLQKLRFGALRQDTVSKKISKAYWTGNSVAFVEMDQEPTEEPCDLHPGRAEMYVITALVKMFTPTHTHILKSLECARLVYFKVIYYAHQDCSKIQ